MKQILLFSAVDSSKSVYISQADFPELESDIFDVDSINIYELSKTTDSSISSLSLCKLDVIGFKKNKNDYSYDIIVFDDLFKITKYKFQLTSEYFKTMHVVSDILGKKSYVYIVSEANICDLNIPKAGFFYPTDSYIDICALVKRLTHEEYIPCDYKLYENY